MLITPITAVSYLDYTIQNNIKRIDQAKAIDAIYTEISVPQSTVLEIYTDNASLVIQSNNNLGRNISIST